MSENAEPGVNGKLELSADVMRAIGYQVIDMLVDHYQSVAQKPVKAYTRSSRTELEARFCEPLPQQGMDIAALVREVHQDVLEENYHRIHPRDFAYVNAPGNYIGVLADALAAGYNVFGGAWVASPAAAMIELVTLDWLRQLVGMPESAGGIFTSGGSVANLTGLAVARHVRLANDMTDVVVYLSEQAHAAVPKALRILGFLPEHIHRLSVDGDFRLDMAALRAALAADRAQGRRPFCVVASAGTTNTGAVDPLPEIAALCQDEHLWLHVDGAYGGAAVLAEKGRAALKGIELSDSMAVDPHKWLFQPYEMGCTLVRDKRHLWETFNVAAEYLKNIVDPTLQEINFFDYGIQMSRSFRALKLWMSLKAFGVKSFEQAVSRGIELAEMAERRLRRSPNWRIVTPAQLGIITFRYHVDGLRETELDTLNEIISKRIVDDGFAFIHTTLLNGRTVLRMVTINPRTTDEDIAETIRRLEQFGSQLI
jgi:aromatic-L-amino-acid decarboxylase